MGPEVACTAARNTRVTSSIVNEVEASHATMAALHTAMLPASSGTRATRSVSHPTGNVASAAASETTEARIPSLRSPMRRACSSCTATAPTVARSALSSPSTHESSTIARTRRRPPAAVISPASGPRAGCSVISGQELPGTV